MFKYLLFIPLLVFAQNLPLTTCDRYVVDYDGVRFKMASVNWYGAHEKKFVVSGLEVRPLTEIVKTIKKAGFNSIRLPFSNQMLDEKTVDPKYLTANPELIGKTPLEIFDKVIEALAAENIIIILNNHISAAGWCCLYEEDGLWYTRKYSERRWIKDWEFLVKRYAHIPQVAGVDLRNEIRVAKWRGTIIPSTPFWGTGTKNDWKRAAQEAGNKILEINPNLLIIVEGINFPRYHLRGVWRDPIQLIRPSQLVYSVHNYSFTKPKLVGPSYGQMSWEEFKKIMDEEWGFVLDLEIGKKAPVWMSEFGASPGDDQKWFSHIIRYLKEKDTDFAYWPLNAGTTFEGKPESYTILEPDWSRPVNDWRWPLIEEIQKPLKPWTKKEVSDCKVPPYRVLAFDQTDAFEDSKQKDWWKFELKGTCGKNARVVGISLGSRKKGPIKSLLCSRDKLAIEESGVVEIVKRSDKEFHNIRTHLDWATGADKMECPKDAFAKGIAQNKRVVRGILCSFVSPNTLGNKCITRNFNQTEDRLKLLPGDWQTWHNKITCDQNEYVAGISVKKGIPESLLCCQ